MGTREWDPCGKQSWTERYAGINHSQPGSAFSYQPLRNDNRNGALKTGIIAARWWWIDRNAPRGASKLTG
jgi:hypothetical protein